MVTKGGTVDAGRLTDFAAKALQKMSVPEEDARITARMLVAADLSDVDSHGVAHLVPFYIRRIKDGLINVKPQVNIFSHAPSTAIMDSDEGLGFVVGYRAMVEAIHRAETTGASFVAVRNSTHFGAVMANFKIGDRVKIIILEDEDKTGIIVVEGNTPPVSFEKVVSGSKPKIGRD